MNRLSKYPICRQCGLRMTPLEQRKTCKTGPYRAHMPQSSSAEATIHGLGTLYDRGLDPHRPGNPDWEPDPEQRGLILDITQLPSMPFFVWARDNYLSGDPGPDHAICIFPCETALEAETVFQILKNEREEMGAVVKVQGSSSRHRRLAAHIGDAGYQHVVFTPGDAPYWFGLDARTSKYLEQARGITFPHIANY